MNNKNFLICLAGLPASGKTVFANKLRISLKKIFKDLKVEIIDPDIIRKNLTSNQFEYEKEHIVRNRNLEIIRSALEQGKIVIADDLNYYSSMRHDLKEIADALDLNFYIIHIATPIEICLKWNEKRGEPIPKEVINKIQDKFDEFNRYNWDNPIVTYDLSQIDLDIVVRDFLAKLENNIMNMKQSPIIEKYSFSYNKYNENLDKITRTYVGKLVLNPDLFPLKKKIFKLRKNFIKKNKNKALSEAEILKSFKSYLEKILKFKIS
ncbi:MAG: AAA family ATPase [Promethearchaeota archaeon]